MTVSSTTRKTALNVGNGVTTSFAFTFKVQSSADIVVYRLENGVQDEVDTADYTVSLNANQNTNPGGSVLFDTAPTSAQSFIISTDADATQELNIQNQATFNPATVMEALDKLTIQVQQLKEKLNRAVTFPITDGLTGELPAADERLGGQILGFNTDTGALEVGGGDVFTYQDISILTNVAELQAYAPANYDAAPPVVYLVYNYVSGDGGGTFYKSATGAADLGVTYATATSGVYYKREIDRTIIDLRWFGVGAASTGRTATQNSDGIDDALEYAHVNSMGLIGVPGASRSDPIKIARTIDLTDKPNIHLVGQGAANSGVYKTCIRWDGHVGGVMVRSNKECRYVVAASTANVDIATLNNGDTIDGIVVATGDYVLLKNQVTASQNGPYLIGASGPATRATYFIAGRVDDFVFKAVGGTVNAGTYWDCTQDPATVTLGTTSLAFTSRSIQVVLDGGGFDGIGFDGYLKASVGLSLWGWIENDNGAVWVEGCTDQQVVMGALSVGNYMGGTWRRLDINAYFSAAGTQDNAGGMKWTSVKGHNSYDVCLSRFGYVRIIHKDGIGFDQGASDTNYGDDILIQRRAGGTGQSWIIRAGDGVLGDGGASDYNYSYDNYWGITGSSVAPLMESGTKPSVSQHFSNIIATSGYAQPDFSATGVSGGFTYPDGQYYDKFANAGQQWYRDSQGRVHMGYTGTRSDGAQLAVYHPTGVITRYKSEAPGADAKVWGGTIASDGSLQTDTYTDAGAFGAVAEQWERSGATPTRKRMFYPIDVPNAGLKVRDTNNSHVLILQPNSDLTADRALTITTGDAARELQLQATAFTPTITVDTTGDLSISYAQQVGRWWRIGAMVWFEIALQFTPTYTTASGEWYVDALPLTIENITLDPAFTFGRVQNVTRPANATVPMIQGLRNATKARITWPLTTGGATSSSVTNIPSGTAVVLAVSGFYTTTA